MNRRPARTDNGKIFPARTFPGQSRRNFANQARRFAVERRCCAPGGSPRLNVAPSFLARRRLSTDRRRIRSILVKSSPTAPFPFVENRRPDSPRIAAGRKTSLAAASAALRPRQRDAPATPFSRLKVFPALWLAILYRASSRLCRRFKIRVLTARGGGLRARKARFARQIPFQTAFRQSFDAARARFTALK